MSRTITSIPELYYDEIVDLGSCIRNINMHLKATFDDGSTEWHYYGTPVPTPAPVGTVVEHQALRFPEDVFNLVDKNDVLFTLAFEVATQSLQA